MAERKAHQFRVVSPAIPKLRPEVRREFSKYRQAVRHVSQSAKYAESENYEDKLELAFASQDAKLNQARKAVLVIPESGELHEKRQTRLTLRTSNSRPDSIDEQILSTIIIRS